MCLRSMVLIVVYCFPSMAVPRELHKIKCLTSRNEQINVNLASEHCGERRNMTNSLSIPKHIRLPALSILQRSGVRTDSVSRPRSKLSGTRGLLMRAAQKQITENGDHLRTCFCFSLSIFLCPLPDTALNPHQGFLRGRRAKHHSSYVVYRCLRCRCGFEASHQVKRVRKSTATTTGSSSTLRFYQHNMAAVVNKKK